MEPAMTVTILADMILAPWIVQALPAGKLTGTAQAIIGRLKPVPAEITAPSTATLAAVEIAASIVDTIRAAAIPLGKIIVAIGAIGTVAVVYTGLILRPAVTGRGENAVTRAVPI